jgi:ubiquinone/menaquinone biosynthesis C-methylase UbiE
MDNRAAFDLIAPSWYRVFHRTRFHADLEALAKRWQCGRLLNAGCGHGADFMPFAGRFELHGVDFSSAMLEMASRYQQKYGFQAALANADVRHLPYSDNWFDWAIAVATYHHLRGADERVAALRELKRVIKPGGEAFLTVWNRGQRRFWFSSQEVMVPWKLPGGPVERYYYLYSYREFGRDLEAAGFTVLKLSPEASYKGRFKRFSRNICALVRR